jgi:hypothetical protein
MANKKLRLYYHDFILGHQMKKKMYVRVKLCRVGL